jgi:putative toxin-antitoxin system antitoxin component (TIGR02293 family)
MAGRKVTGKAKPKATSKPVVSFLQLHAAPSCRVQLFGDVDTIAVREMITHHGVKGSALRGVRERLGLTIADVARVLGAGERTIIRKEQTHASLSATESDRAYRLARIADLATELIGDERKAAQWLRTLNTYLGGESPVDMLDTEIGTDLVVESLYAIAYGGVA